MFNWFRKSENGFTLVELMMVIVILGVLAGVAVPMMGNLKANAEKNKLLATADAVGSAAVYYAAQNGEAPSTDATLASAVSWTSDIHIKVGATAPAKTDTAGLWLHYTVDTATNTITITGYRVSADAADDTVFGAVDKTRVYKY